MILIKYSSQFFPWIVTYSVLHCACLSRWMQDVARVNSVRCGVFMCSCFSCSSRKVTKSATDITSKDGQNRILACKFSPSWRYFAACDDAKRLYLFQCGERWELVSNRYVEFSEVRWQGKNCWLAVNTSSAYSSWGRKPHREPRKASYPRDWANKAQSTHRHQFIVLWGYFPCLVSK